MIKKKVKYRGHMWVNLQTRLIILLPNNILEIQGSQYTWHHAVNAAKLSDTIMNPRTVCTVGNEPVRLI